MGAVSGHVVLASCITSLEIYSRFSSQGDICVNPLHLVVRLSAGLSSRGRNVWFRTLGVRLMGYVWMRRISIPRNWSDITLEAGVSLDDGVVLLCSGPARRDKIQIKTETYINRNTILDAH